MKFGGHQSFYLKDGWLYKGLDLSNRRPEWLDSSTPTPEVMQQLGVGKNMVLSIRYWLQATQLVTTQPVSQPSTSRQPTNPPAYKLSPMAHTILKHDPYFELDGTLFLLHYALATNKNTAPVWHWFFNQFSAAEFDKEALLNACCSYMQIHCEKSVQDKTVDKDLQCLLRMYQGMVYEGKKNPENNTPSPFNKYGWLEQRGGLYKRHKLYVDDFNTSIFAHLVGVFLNSLGQAKSVSLEELCTKENSVGRVFNLSLEQTSELVEKSQPYLNYSKTGGYFIVSPNKAKLKQALQNYYHQQGRH